MGVETGGQQEVASSAVVPSKQLCASRAANGNVRPMTGIEQPLGGVNVVVKGPNTLGCELEVEGVVIVEVAE